MGCGWKMRNRVHTLDRVRFHQAENLYTRSRYQIEFSGSPEVDTRFEINISSYVGQWGTGSHCAGERVVTHDQEAYTRTNITERVYGTRLQACLEARVKLLRINAGMFSSSEISRLRKILGNPNKTSIPSLIIPSPPPLPELSISHKNGRLGRTTDCRNVTSFFIRAALRKDFLLANHPVLLERCIV